MCYPRLGDAEASFIDSLLERSQTLKRFVSILHLLLDLLFASN